MNKTKKIKPVYKLDITDQVCPLTFVKTKLMLESIPANSTLEIRLKGSEPLHNIPISVTENGHSVLLIEPENSAENAQQIHRIVVQKTSD